MYDRRAKKELLGNLAVECVLHHAKYGVISHEEACARLQTLDSLDLVVPYVRSLIASADLGSRDLVRGKLDSLDSLGFEVGLGYELLERKLSRFGGDAA